MSTAIMEFALSFYSGRQQIPVPEGSIPLKVVVKYGSPFLILKRPYHSAGTKTMYIQAVTAGQEIPDKCYYIDSALAPGDIIYSFFEMES